MSKKSRAEIEGYTPSPLAEWAKGSTFPKRGFLIALGRLDMRLKQPIPLEYSIIKHGRKRSQFVFEVHDLQDPDNLDRIYGIGTTVQDASMNYVEKLAARIRLLEERAPFYLPPCSNFPSFIETHLEKIR